MEERLIKKYAEIVGYTEAEIEKFHDGGHRIRHVSRLSRAASKFSIQVEVARSKNCNSGHVTGQTFTLDLDGNLITRLCPDKMCIYLLSQFTIPVALINERLSEGLKPDDFHFMRHLRCPDTGVDCLGYGEVMAEVRIVPRIK